MSTGAAYGAGAFPSPSIIRTRLLLQSIPPAPNHHIYTHAHASIYTSPDLGTSLQYAGHNGHHATPHGGAVAVVEYATGDGAQTSFLRSANPHVVVNNARAVCLRFLLVPRKGDAGGEGK